MESSRDFPQWLRRPNVGAKLTLPDCSTSSSFDPHSQMGRGLELTGDNQAHLVVTLDPKLPLERGDGGDAALEVHTSILNPSKVDATPKGGIPNIGLTGHPPEMDWPQRDRFALELRKYSDRTEETHAEIASKLGVSTASLRNYLYKSKKPGFITLQKASALFGCSVTLFVDDPGKKGKAAPEGQDTFVETIRDLGSKMRPEQREWLLESAKALVRTSKRVPPPELPGNTTGEKCRLAREYYDHTIPQVVIALKQRKPTYPISEERLERIEADLEKPEAALLVHLGDIYGIDGYKLEATPTAPKPKADEKAKHRSAR